MQSPLISCIVPVYNGERYLSEAIDSILAQTYRPLEIIVVDDGSTDGTAEVVACYDERVRYVWQSNAGPWIARNLGLSATQGEFISFLDADDLWHAEKLARQMARFEARPELDLCVTHLQNFWIPELEGEEASFREHRLSQVLPGYSTVTLLARHTCFEKVGHFSIALQHAAATDWFMRATDYGLVMELLPDLLVYRRPWRSRASARRARRCRRSGCTTRRLRAGPATAPSCGRDSRRCSPRGAGR